MHAARAGQPSARVIFAEEIYGYALFRHALERGEEKPEWEVFRSNKVCAYFKRSLSWLETNRKDKLIG